MRATPIKDELYENLSRARKEADKNNRLEAKRMKDGWRWVEVVENNVKTLVFRK